jgi:hypothetical protein
MILTYSLIIIAAICNAVMDTIKHHWENSVFYWHFEVPGFWYKFFHKEGWSNSYIDNDPKKGRKIFLGMPIHPAFLDGWHFCKSLMLTCFILAIVTFDLTYPSIHFITLGMTWILTFNVFYNKILRK